MHTETRELNDAELEQVSGGYIVLPPGFEGIAAGTEVYFAVKKMFGTKGAGPAGGDKGPAGPVPA
jgi:bacteriocin-like protein